jgi:hypothetical protein
MQAKLLPLVQCFDVAQAPRLVENRALRPVEAEQDEPMLVSHGLNPVRFMALRRRGAKVHINRTSGVLHDALIGRCKGHAPRYVHERAVFIVLDRRRPELRHRRIRRHLEPVVTRAVKRLALRVGSEDEVGARRARALYRTPCVIVKRCPSVDVDESRIEKRISKGCLHCVPG